MNKRALQLLTVLQIVWTLGDVIVKLRKQKRWGRKKLAHAAGVSYSTITRLETNREMKEASIRAVAVRAFGLTPADLYALVPRAAGPLERERDRLWFAVERSTREKWVEVMRSYEPAQSDTDRESAHPLPLASGEKASAGSRGPK